MCPPPGYIDLRLAFWKKIFLEVCFLEEAEEKAAVTTPQSALHSLQRSRREIRFSTKLPQCFLPNLDIFVFFRPFYLSVSLSVFFYSTQV